MNLKDVQELHQKVTDTQLPSDRMMPKMNFGINFKTVFTDIENWHYQPSLVSDNWFTDGSRSSVGVGAGVYGESQNIKISESLGKVLLN